MSHRSCGRPGTRLDRLGGLLMVAIPMFAGCSGPSPRSLTPNPHVAQAEYLVPPAKIAVAASAQAPQIQVDGLGGWSEHTKQAMRGATQDCFFYYDPDFNNTIDGKRADGGHQTDELGMVLVLLSAGCTAIAAPVAAVAGAVTTPGTSEVQDTRNRLSPHLNAQAMQDTLRDRFLAAARNDGRQFAVTSVPFARDDHPAATNGADVIVELAMTDVRLEGAGVNPPLRLSMQAHARLVRTRDHAELYADDYFYQGQRLRLSEWSADGGARLAHGLATGYQTLAANIYDNIFLLHPYPYRDARAGVFGLAPVEPRRYLGDAKTETLRPTLRWESFPRRSDREAAPAEMARVQQVRYDLRVSQVSESGEEVVYRRDGLPGNSHTIDAALSPSTRYAWSVRAHFELDGRERVTEWSIPFGAALFHHPYQFVTPSAAP